MDDGHWYEFKIVGSKLCVPTAEILVSLYSPLARRWVRENIVSTGSP